MLSREGGIEIVVHELSTRMSARGHHVVAYDRNTHHVSGEEIDKKTEYEGVKIIPVWTIEKKGLAAMTSSLSAAWKASLSCADVIHIHAEGPAAMCGLVRFLWRIRGKKRKLIVTVHGLDWARAKWGGFASKYIKFGEKQAVKYADEIIVLSRGVQEYFKVTTLNEMYLQDGLLDAQLLGRGFAWLDTGTFSSLLAAENFVETLETRQSITISAPEEIAYVNGWIDKAGLLQSAEAYGKSPYGAHLKAVAEGKVRY